MFMPLVLLVLDFFWLPAVLDLLFGLIAVDKPSLSIFLSKLVPALVCSFRDKSGEGREVVLLVLLKEEE